MRLIVQYALPVDESYNSRYHIKPGVQWDVGSFGNHPLFARIEAGELITIDGKMYAVVNVVHELIKGGEEHWITYILQPDPWKFEFVPSPKVDKIGA